MRALLAVLVLATAAPATACMWLYEGTLTCGATIYHVGSCNGVGTDLTLKSDAGDIDVRLYESPIGAQPIPWTQWLGTTKTGTREIRIGTARMPLDLARVPEYLIADDGRAEYRATWSGERKVSKFLAEVQKFDTSRCKLTWQ